MRVGPEGFAAFGVEYGEVCVSDRGRLVIVWDSVFVDSAGLFDGASLAAGIDDMATFWRRGGEQKDEIGLSFVGDDQEPAPILEFIERGLCHFGSAGAVFEENGVGGKDCGEIFCGDEGVFVSGAWVCDGTAVGMIRKSIAEAKCRTLAPPNG